jgi:DNA repair protein RecO (recombination protein O)
MVIKAEGLVLKCFPYSDSSLIARVFTRQHGLVSFMIPGGRNNRNKSGNLLQPTHLLAFEMYWKEQSNFQKLKECRALTIYSELYNDFSRKAIALFMCEVLSSLLEEKEQNEELFNFMQYSLQELDVAKEVSALYPSIFLLSLSNVLGFYPAVSTTGDGDFFDVENGVFTESGVHTLNPASSRAMKALLTAHYHGQPYPVTAKDNRTELLQGLLEYYRWHIAGFRQMKSPELLHILLA